MQSILDYNYMHYKVVANKTYNRIFCSLSTTNRTQETIGTTSYKMDTGK